MNFRVIPLIIIFYSAQTLSSELTVYRWIDENNVVHFSQHQPVGDEYTQFFVSNQSKIISRADPIKQDVTSTSESESESDKQSEQPLTSTLNVSSKCKEAKDNINTLMTFDKVQYINESGQKQVLTKQEIQNQLAINKKRTEVYCTPKND